MPAPEKMQAPRELTADELRNVGVIVPEPPVVEKAPAPAPVQAVVEKPKEVVVADADVAVKAEPTSATKAEPASEPGAAPAEPAQPHTTFVRIRRWFGTGSPN